MTQRRSVLAGVSALLLPATARAQPWPDRPVRYIVPFTPAGITDMMARLVGHRLAEMWGRPVVIENRPGGNALIGADAAAKAAPDGYTLLAITLTHAVNATLFPQAPYDFRRDFAAVSLLAGVPLVVCVNAQSPARDLQGLVALARRQRINGGSSGNGSPAHLALETLRRAAGLGDAVTHVPYRGGAPAVTDLVAGTIDLLISNLPECIAQVTSGRLRALAVTGPNRHAQLPEVPTVREAEMPALEMSNWTAMVTQAAVPAPIRARLEQDTLAALQDGDLRRRAEEAGFELIGWDAERSARFVAAETERWSRLVREAGIRADS